MRRRLFLLALAARPARAARAARVLLVRHALTDPGIGDPPHFALGACATQRNLSPEGREQSRRIGARVAAAGLRPQRVRSSAWCRCIDTATLAFGAAEVWDALNSLHGASRNAAAQTAELQRTLAALAPGRVEAWVSHAATIRAWTGLDAAMGETLVIEADAGGVRLLQRITV